MEPLPSVLLIDDGELERVHQLLLELGADCFRHQGPPRGPLPRPRDLLITSGKHTLDPPDFAGEGAEPIWVCMHGQDYHPLRQRLRSLGVHYLAQLALDDDTLRLFLQQLLYRGAERRRCLRLPVGTLVECRIDRQESTRVKLVELWAEGCLLHTPDAAPPGARLRVGLPSFLAEGDQELWARVERSIERETQDPRSRWVVVTRFEALPDDVTELVEAVVHGERMGTRVTPLAPLPTERAAGDDEGGQAYLDGDGIPDWEAMAREADRREAPRRPYRQHVDTFSDFGSQGPRSVFGHDLSVDGVRIVGHPPLPDGGYVTLALHTGSREEPVIVEARVVRSSGESGIGLAFREMDSAVRERIERLVAAQPGVESLASGYEDHVVVSSVLAVGGSDRD